MLEGKPDRVPLIELYVDDAVKSAFLGKAIRTPADEVEFWVEAGYDYVPVSLGLIEVGAVFSGEATRTKKARYSIYTDAEVEMTWAAEHEGVVKTEEDLEKFEFPPIEQMGFSRLERILGELPEGMKVIAIIGKVFTAAWMLMGFESFAIAAMEGSPLLDKIFRRVGEIQFAVLRKALSYDGVGAAWMSDDIAFGTGLMVKPDLLRRYVFSWYSEMGKLCHEKGLPFIYHSDGNLEQVFDDLIATGFDALHPIEPNAMDIRKIKRQVGDKLCLLGNIEVDRLARGTPDEIRQMARANIRDLAYDGGYCLGSSNSVTYYIPVENYRAMIETVFE